MWKFIIILYEDYKAAIGKLGEFLFSIVCVSVISLVLFPDFCGSCILKAVFSIAEIALLIVIIYRIKNLEKEDDNSRYSSKLWIIVILWIIACIGLAIAFYEHVYNG